MRRLPLVCVAAISAVSCATPDEAPVVNYQNAQWAANGWLDAESEPEVLGLYLAREECDAALGEWMNAQAAGAAVRGECLPIDRR